MANKLLFVFLFVIILSIGANSQVIKGKVIDGKTKQPIPYVNIGLLDLPMGTITTPQGYFNLNCEQIPVDAQVVISSIGYEKKMISLNELIKKNTILLSENPVQLEEVTIKWHEEFEKVGTWKTSSRMGGVCGWGGTDFGSGHEIGLKVDLGTGFSKIEDINVKIHKQSFDTIIFRLHIRTIENRLPADELLTENIFLPVTIYRGWQKTDLSDYNIKLQGEVVLSLEWIGYSNVIEKNKVKVNGSKVARANVLFNWNSKKGTFFMRKGSAARWMRLENKSPGFYLTLKK